MFSPEEKLSKEILKAIGRFRLPRRDRFLSHSKLKKKTELEIPPQTQSVGLNLLTFCLCNENRWKHLQSASYWIRHHVIVGKKKKKERNTRSRAPGAASEVPLVLAWESRHRSAAPAPQRRALAGSQSETTTDLFTPRNKTIPSLSKPAPITGEPLKPPFFLLRTSDWMGQQHARATSDASLDGLKRVP